VGGDGRRRLRRRARTGVAERVLARRRDLVAARVVRTARDGGHVARRRGGGRARDPHADEPRRAETKRLACLLACLLLAGCGSGSSAPRVPFGSTQSKPASLRSRFSTRTDGRCIFTPWYGALAHAIFFRVRTLDYFHTHVCAPGASGCTSSLGATRVEGSSSTPGRLRVGVLVPVAGTWRLFLQCRANGRVLTVPFTLEVT